MKRNRNTKTYTQVVEDLRDSLSRSHAASADNLLRAREADRRLRTFVDQLIDLMGLRGSYPNTYTFWINGIEVDEATYRGYDRRLTTNSQQMKLYGYEAFMRDIEKASAAAEGDAAFERLRTAMEEAFEA